MGDDPVQSLIPEWQGMSDEEIIAAHHTDFYDESLLHVRKAFDNRGIAELEVAAWVRRHIK